MIAALGTTYKRTGFHFDKRLEKLGSDIFYLEKDKKYSFVNNKEELTHKLIIGDNYHALQNLLITYNGMIDIIYIDPPYGKDDLGNFAKTNYMNSISRDNLLSMLYPRLQLAKMLLSDNGAIFVSIDDKNQAVVKCLMDEIFGEKKFVTCIPRLTKSQRSGQENYMDISHDYILVYANCNDFLHITNRKFDINNICEDNIGKYIKGDTKAILAAKSQGYSKGGDYDYKYKGKIYQPIDENGNRNRWLWKKERMIAADKLGILVPSGDTLRCQLYIDKKFDEKTNTMVEKDPLMIFHTSDFMSNNEYSNSTGDKLLQNILGNQYFSNPKPIELIKQLISLHENKDAIVLDFFAGSGTTGHAVLDLNQNENDSNRTFILCTNNEILDNIPNGIAYDITLKRLKRIMTGSCYKKNENYRWKQNNQPYGGNLDVYTIKKINNATQTTNQSPFDVIDETCYGFSTFKDPKKKIEWVCENFERVQYYIDGEN